MRFNAQILSYLKTNGEFCTWVEKHLKESRKNVETALDQIVNTIINAIGIQCITNIRLEEIFKMAKELATTEINTTWLLPDRALQVKGNGVNSEIFGEKFGSIVNAIALQSNLKSSSVYKLFLVLTPLILADIYYNYKARRYCMEQMAELIGKMTKGTRLSPEVRESLIGLQKNTQASYRQ